MKELSLNILDIAENSLKAGATLTEITLREDEKTLVLLIKDNGCGMSEETLSAVANPFYTTRTTRKVGLGIPFLKLAAEQTGGSLEIRSTEKKDGYEGKTELVASFFKDHIDFTPLGDVVSTVITLIQGHPDRDFLYRHVIFDKEVRLDTRELREVLKDVSLAEFEVLSWIRDHLNEQYNEILNIKN
jgi:hypothetical protein